MIREACLADLRPLTAMAGRFHAAAGLRWGFDPLYAEAHLRRHLTDASATVIVWDADGQAVGAIAGMLVPQVWYPQVWAIETGWWVEPGHRGRAWRPMLRAFEAWAAARGADAVTMSALDDRTLTLLARAGYEPQAERHAIRRLR